MSEDKKLEYPVVENFSPEVTVEIFGINDTTKVVATVDTGYTGFLSVPLAIGLKTNLRLFGSRYSQMADGRKVKKLECFGKIRFGGKELFGIISLSETSEDSLLGMQFLESLDGDFTVSSRKKRAIFIIPEAEDKSSKKTKKPKVKTKKTAKK